MIQPLILYPQGRAADAQRYLPFVKEAVDNVLLWVSVRLGRDWKGGWAYPLMHEVDWPRLEPSTAFPTVMGGLEALGYPVRGEGYVPDVYILFLMGEGGYAGTWHSDNYAGVSILSDACLQAISGDQQGCLTTLVTPDLDPIICTPMGQRGAIAHELVNHALVWGAEHTAGERDVSSGGYVYYPDIVIPDALRDRILADPGAQQLFVPPLPTPPVPPGQIQPLPLPFVPSQYPYSFTGIAITPAGVQADPRRVQAFADGLLLAAAWWDTIGRARAGYPPISSRVYTYDAPYGVGELDPIPYAQVTDDLHQRGVVFAEPYHVYVLTIWGLEQIGRYSPPAAAQMLISSGGTAWSGGSSTASGVILVAGDHPFLAQDVTTDNPAYPWLVLLRHEFGHDQGLYDLPYTAHAPLNLINVSLMAPGPGNADTLTPQEWDRVKARGWPSTIKP